MTPNRAPLRLTRRGETTAAWAIWIALTGIMGIIGGLERGSIPLPW